MDLTESLASRFYGKLAIYSVETIVSVFDNNRNEAARAGMTDN